MTAVKRSAAVTLPAPAPGRSVALDVFRGLAIAAMLLDHVVLVTGGPELLRLSAGRLAMSAFFILAGHLSRNLGYRHLGIALVGVVLPLLVPWIDTPNVLVWWVVGCASLWLLRWAELPGWVLTVVALTVAANGWGYAPGFSYDGFALLGLMGLGTIVPRSAYAWAGRLPTIARVPLAAVGRRPLTWYVGHLLVLQGIVTLFR